MTPKPKWTTAVFAVLTLLLCWLVLFPPSLETPEKRIDTQPNWAALSKHITPVSTMAATPKPIVKRKIKMAIPEIVRGQSGQGELIETLTGHDSEIDGAGPPDYWFFNGNQIISGWTCDQNGNISTNSSNSSSGGLGEYTVTYWHYDEANGFDDNFGEWIGTRSTYRFKVVCMTTKAEATLLSSLVSADGTHYENRISANATNEGGTGPFTYNWTLPPAPTTSRGRARPTLDSRSTRRNRSRQGRTKITTATPIIARVGAVSRSMFRTQRIRPARRRTQPTRPGH